MTSSERHHKAGCELATLVLRNYDRNIVLVDAAKVIAAALAEAEREGMKLGYLAGFSSSGEGWNGEYPFSDDGKSPLEDVDWVSHRDRILAAAITP